MTRTRPEAPGDLAAQVQEAIELLERIRDDRGLLAEVAEEQRTRLLVAAGQVARPGPVDKRRLVRAGRRRQREARRRADEALLSATGIRRTRAEPVFPTPALAGPRDRHAGHRLSEGPAAAPAVQAARVCYVCKAEFQQVHHFYDAMCPPCAELNWRKRHQTADLHGRVALVTGARVKIGYQAAIKLLRAGCHVVVTTRFPRDAARRFAREPDASEWTRRLHVYGIDLRHTPSVETFCKDVLARYDRLDFILNNACQTVRRPAGFYDHLMRAE
ncbi:MAG TPA: SDR family NAD(P)-dependent oxidoreductase, partial [Kofleriaceae bacterium]|nr:SDR family NAD(P)-dependent oxidoreductase [Kofleriaceae bacterium]